MTFRVKWKRLNLLQQSWLSHPSIGSSYHSAPKNNAVPDNTTWLWMEVLLGLVLALTACNAGITPASARKTATNRAAGVQVFEGFYEAAADISSFVPCDMNELPGYGKGYWLVSNDEFSQLYGHPEGITIGDIGSTYGPGDRFAIYVRFEGNLSPVGDVESGKGYGYLGLYGGVITVTKALKAERLWVGPADEEPGGHRKLCHEKD